MRTFGNAVGASGQARRLEQPGICARSHDLRCQTRASTYALLEARFFEGLVIGFPFVTRAAGMK